MEPSRATRDGEIRDGDAALRAAPHSADAPCGLRSVLASDCANQFAAIRAIRIEIDCRSGFASLSTEIFCTSRLACLTRCHGELGDRMRICLQAVRSGLPPPSAELQETLISSAIFLRSGKIPSRTIMIGLRRECGRVGALKYATSGMPTCTRVPECAKTLVFLSHCSNSSAVLAIPACTVTTSPLTHG